LRRRSSILSSIARGLWAPASLSTVLWLRADSLPANSTNVTTWSDESGNGNHATQGAGGAPTYTASWRNGRPALAFNGSQWLDIASPLTGAKPWTIHAVLQLTLAGSRAIFATGDNNTGVALSYNGSGGAGKREVVAKAVAFALDGNATANAEHWTAVCDSGGTIAFYVNGVATTLTPDNPAANAPSTSSAVGALRISDGLWGMLGNVAEIVVMNSAISAADRALLHAYSSAKYNI
jgi:hypothetical protein